MFVPDNAAEALADAWASLDGNLIAFRRGKKAKSIEAWGGHYAGYLVEAEEVIWLLKVRGYGLRKLREGKRK